jgi:hypothetical protein
MISLSILRAQSSDSTFVSPKHKFLIKFEEIGRNTFPDSTENNIRYRLTFTNNNSRKKSVIEYHDVHWDRKPTELINIVDSIIWSPSEDFVILPEEDWQRAPGSSEHHVLNLNPKFSWPESTMIMEPSVWLDSLTILGDSPEDCDFSVSMFNGRTGETVCIKESNSPLGFTLTGIEGDEVLIKTVLDNCQSDDDVERFTSKVISIKISSIRDKWLK